jgi:hypothetical protein
VKRASGLPLYDHKAPKAYVVIRVGDRKEKTKHARRSQTPVWNETFTLYVPDVCDAGAALSLTAPVAFLLPPIFLSFSPFITSISCSIVSSARRVLLSSSYLTYRGTGQVHPIRQVVETLSSNPTAYRSHRSLTSSRDGDHDLMFNLQIEDKSSQVSQVAAPGLETARAVTQAVTTDMAKSGELSRQPSVARSRPALPLATSESV